MVRASSHPVKDKSLRVLELFCGIGGCAAALEGSAEIVAAVDINRRAIEIYRDNFRHPVFVRTIESLATSQLAEWDAQLWWLSPPCQPYTSRGRKRDVSDPRAAALLHMIQQIRALRPNYVGLENVAGFRNSESHRRLREMLDECRYQVIEVDLCPSQLGVPNRRRRFYLIASRNGLEPIPQIGSERRSEFTLSQILDELPGPSLTIDAEVASAYRRAIHIVDPEESTAVTHCFTSAYGRSIHSSGSYLKTKTGCRRFSPQEILRLLSFPSRFRFPRDFAPLELWPLVGNSLAISAMRVVLGAIPEFRG